MGPNFPNHNIDSGVTSSHVFFFFSLSIHLPVTEMGILPLCVLIDCTSSRRRHHKIFIKEIFSFLSEDCLDTRIGSMENNFFLSGVRNTNNLYWSLEEQHVLTFELLVICMRGSLKKVLQKVHFIDFDVCSWARFS